MLLKSWYLYQDGIFGSKERKISINFVLLMAQLRESTRDNGQNYVFYDGHW